MTDSEVGERDRESGAGSGKANELGFELGTPVAQWRAICRRVAHRPYHPFLDVY